MGLMGIGKTTRLYKKGRWIMAKKKELVIIDVVHTEDGYDIFKLGKNGRPDFPAEICQGNGLFYSEGELEEFVRENKKEIEVVEDYR